MPEALSAAIVGAKILDILLGQAIGKGVDGLLGGASKALKDARSELDKETKERAARMTLLVQTAAEELQPALEQIKLETGQDHSALFQHPPFLAQVAQALLTNLTLDVDAFRAEYQAMFSDGRWADLDEPLDLFFAQLKLLLARDAQWGPALREFRREAQQAGLHASALQLVELAGQIAATLDAHPERTAEAIHRPEKMRLDAWERTYLIGLYAECNELPLASDTTPDASRSTPRMQRVYVDLDADQRLTLKRVLDRLGVPPAKEQAARTALMRLGPDAAGQRFWEGDLSEEFTRGLARDLRQARLLGQEERTEELKQLGIEPETLAQALKPVTAFEIIREHRQLVLLGDPGSGKSTLTRRIAGLFAAVAGETGDGQAERDRDWRSGMGGAFDHWHTPIRIILSRWAKRLPAKAGGVADELLDECLHVLREAGNVGDDRLRTYLTDRLCARPAQVVLLLDGLDEVTDDQRRAKLIAATADFCQTYAHVPLLVTCRARPYGEDASYRLPLPAVTLAPLSDDSVASFLQRWHDELVTARLYEPGEAVQAQRRLQGAIGDPERPDLRRLADSPLQLTIMARVNYKQGLPGSRAMLYEMYVNELLLS
jgi:energy-coupling factor transporter ATP-binding protein EcfA2